MSSTVNTSRWPPRSWFARTAGFLAFWMVLSGLDPVDLSVGALAAIVLDSIVALRQERLKLLIAYSTLAQIGYLFLMFPLAFSAGSAQLESSGALTGAGDLPRHREGRHVHVSRIDLRGAGS